MYHENILGAIGNTPLVKLNKVTKGVKATVLAKVEFFNPGNSIKDRMALKMVEEAEKKGLLKPGGTIVEGTSGNTGMGLAICGIVKGYKCIFTTTDKQSKEKTDVMKAMGAEVIVCPTDVEPEDPRSYYSTSRRIAQETPNAFYVNQYDNLANTQAHYETTGPEIWEQTEGKITHLVVGTGTGGTISGAGKYLKEKNPNIKIWAIDTYGSALKKYHETGEIDPKEIYTYITEGIGEDIIPANIDFKVIDHFEKVTDKDGALMARRITKEEGIFVGYSAGSAVAGLLQMKEQLKETDVVVVVFHDHGSRYVAKLYNEDWLRDRRFLEVTMPDAESIIRKKEVKHFLTIAKDKSLREAIAVMKAKGISQLPVTENGELVGSVSEHIILNALLNNLADAQKNVGELMSPPFPFVDLNATTKEISALINKVNSAVLVTDRGGHLHIITEYDLIQAIAG
ncbi:MAG: pyridoxal-phosphate dependent enzyme [Chitinophagales bacterium]|nr:pyridoxal-phosphate dependent enzyme [Chitinophagales bacterium]